jgi:Rrf2 family nitric oxide-sensitive transcriptional repressor
LNRLNRKVEYALMALKVMAHKRAGELTSAKEIVEATGCPFDATARVLQQMAQKEILRSEQGAHGGYVLIRDLSKLSVFDLMQVILGPMAVARCLTIEADCELKSKCNIVSPVATFNRRLSEFYQNLTIGEILRTKKPAHELEVVR